MRYKVLDRDFNTNDHPFWQMVEDGHWENAIIEKLAELVKPTDTILDVGAWIGVYTLLLSQLAKRVIAFEPNPYAMIILIDNLRNNGIQNVIVSPYAISDQEGTEQLFFYNPDGMDEVLGASMANMVGRGNSPINVHTTTIDKYCRAHNIKPDGMKIDVEGYESKVLAGCNQDCWKLIELHGMFAKKPETDGELIDGDWLYGHLFVKGESDGNS